LLKAIVVLPFLLCSMASWGDSQATAVTGYANILQLGTPNHDVRYISGNTVYVEGLINGHWVGRYWSAGGRLNVPYELSDGDDAFALQVGQQDSSEGATWPSHQWLKAGWEWVSAQELPPSARGAHHFVVELKNQDVAVTLRVHTLVDGTPILVRWLELRNDGKTPLPLRAVFPWTARLWNTQAYQQELPPGSDHVFTVGTFDRISHGWEGWLKWKKLINADEHVESHVGHGYKAPFFIARNDAVGEYVIAHLAWSGNWDIDVHARQDGENASLFFKAGPWAPYVQRVIAPGESVATPSIHLGPVQGSLDDAVHAMDEHVREFVMPARDQQRAYLVQYAVPGDQGYIAKQMGDLQGMNEKNIYEQIDLASALGAELFIVDAGWWDPEGYGDWEPSPTRFPHGLAPIADYIHKKGMLFGLYNEVVGGRGDWSHSKFYKQHPDWFIPPYYLVDMTNSAAVEFVHQQIRHMIQDYKIDLFRLDYNPGYDYEMGQHVRDGIPENDYWRYYDNTYRLFEEVKKEFPKVILQQAAAGGGRNDLGFVSRFDEQYTTDGLDFPPVLQDLSGQLLGLPPEMFATAFGIPAHSPNRGYLDTHLRLTFTTGTPWLAPIAYKLGDIDPAIVKEYRRHVLLYKSFIRPLLPTCVVYHHAPLNAYQGVDESPWFALEFDSPDRSKGWATFAKLYASPDDTYVFKPRGLDAGKDYRVVFDSTQSARVISGFDLMRDGIPVRLETPWSSELILFEAAAK